MNKERLALWQARLAHNADAFSTEAGYMDEREELYRGDNVNIVPLTTRDLASDGTYKRATHVRNIVSENVESMVNSVLPQPKVSARREKDEDKARLIENMLRNEMDRMPFEAMNDVMERTVPIQGGGLFLVEWDNTERTHTTVGEVVVSTIHPKQVVPQDGVYTSVEDMDYIILKLPQTKEYIKRKYNVDVLTESETEPEMKGVDTYDADDIVTQYIAYYRGDNGIGLYSWVNDTEIEDLEDYQARRLKRCSNCEALEPAGSDSDTCPYCGGKEFKQNVEEFEEVYIPIQTSGGVIPGATPSEDGTIKPTKIPFYKPDVYPVVLQKNISAFGKFLGESDVDKIKYQQNTINRIEMKIIDRIIKAGTRVTLPDRADFKVNPDDQEVWYIGDPVQKNLIDSYNFTGDLQYELMYLAGVYEEARQILGITDSFQGRKDPTATSGVAKQFAANQSAGRLASKRVMKEAAYAELFKLIFQFKLAYTDEPRPVVAMENGKTVYGEFNRYDFLEMDEAGEYYWNDQFIFSCDTTDLANNREAMWENATAHLQAGAYGNPQELDTLIFYWTKMELLHYPGATETKKALEEKQIQQQQMMQQTMMQQIDQAAKEQAMKDVGIRGGGPIDERRKP